MSSNTDSDKLKQKISFITIGQKEKNVPEEEAEPACPITTGYPVLDTLLFGGITQRYAIALAAPPCDEKDLIIKRFLKAGVEDDQPTFYVCIEPSLAGSFAVRYPSTFNLFVCNPVGEAVVKEASNITILKGLENLTNLNIALVSAMRKLDPSRKGSRRICINVVSDVLLQLGPVQTRKWLIELITQLKSAGFTTLSIVDPQLHPPEQLNAVLSLFDGEVGIREAETDRGFGRYLRIKRMRNQKYSKDEAYLAEEDQQDFKASDLRSRGFMKLS